MQDSREGLAVTLRFVIAATAMLLLLSGFTQAELEKAKNTKEFFTDGYWKCLATEVVRVVPTSMSAQEFSVFTKQASALLARMRVSITKLAAAPSYWRQQIRGS